MLSLKLPAEKDEKMLISWLKKYGTLRHSMAALNRCLLNTDAFALESTCGDETGHLNEMHAYMLRVGCL